MNNDFLTLSNALSSSGYRLTAARQAILKALTASEGHISADELVSIVHRQRPSVGRMTVYRTLELLTELGLIRPIYQGTAAAHYVLMDQGHHHHLICTACQGVIEFDACVLRELERAVGDDFQFEVQGHLLEIYGRCRDCQKQAAGS